MHAALTPQQVAYFDAFGYLRLPGLFADDIGDIEDAFEAIFGDDSQRQIEIDVELHRNERRLMIPRFIDRHPTLAKLRDDPRIVEVVNALLGPGYEYAESDGNLYYCDSEWHCDIYGSPLTIRHLKVSFYLDRLDATTGAVRLMPGTNHWQSPYARDLRTSFKSFGQIPSIYGVEATDIPCVVLDSKPGDLLVWDFRTIHAAYNGLPRRRLFTLNFREAAPADA